MEALVKKLLIFAQPDGIMLLDKILIYFQLKLTLISLNTVELVADCGSNRAAELSLQYSRSLKHLPTDFLQNTIHLSDHNK